MEEVFFLGFRCWVALFQLVILLFFEVGGYGNYSFGYCFEFFVVGDEL